MTGVQTCALPIWASILTEVVSILLMLAAAAIGYFVGEQQEKKAEQENVTEETLEAEAVFSDRQMEDYELKDAEEAQKQNI